MGCSSSYFSSFFTGTGREVTVQDLSKSNYVQEGMTTDEVRVIMGEPVMTELYRNVEAWYYCRTTLMFSVKPDRFLAIFL